MVTHPAVSQREVGRAAGKNMRIVNREGGSEREFSFGSVKMLKKESITLLEAKSCRETSETEDRGTESSETKHRRTAKETEGWPGFTL